MFEEFGLKKQNSASYCTRDLILGSKSLYISETEKNNLRERLSQEKGN